MEKKDEYAEKDLRQRLTDFQDHPEDVGLNALLFQYGRYLLIAASRPGTQPANLQGIWNAELVPPWFSDYTININTEMNYWQTGPCNLEEMGEPLVRLCEEMAADGKKETAMHYFGKKRESAVSIIRIFGERRHLLMEELSGTSGQWVMPGFAGIFMTSTYSQRIRHIWSGFIRY